MLVHLSLDVICSLMYTVFLELCSLKTVCILHIHISYIYIKPLKSEAIHETGLSGYVVASFFPLIIFIYIYIYIYNPNLTANTNIESKKNVRMDNF